VSDQVATKGCAVVTGAGRGIGRAVALALGRRGVSVALLARTRSELDEVARAFAATSSRGALAHVTPCDVGDGLAVAAAAREVLGTFGPPLVVINNAGIIRRARAEETTEEDWDAVLRVNLKGTFLVTRAFLPAMLERGRGRIVNVASISATVGTARQTAYNAAKWGVVGFTKSLAEELRGTGLQALAVLPGAVDTAMLEGSGFAPQMSAEVVAESLVFAAMDAPDAMNGSALEIFGP
jgi:3-oxoacyl-[acyl-carrier protein] reductase